MSALLKFGLFIVIDGIDGCGKSTQSKMLVDALNKLGKKSILTAEPTKGAFGQIFRDNLYTKEYIGKIDALTLACDRLDHCESFIKPNLEDGTNVISDRYLDSSLVYQSVQDENLSIDWLKSINKFCIKPDIVIILDVSVNIAIERLNKRANEKAITKFENEEFLKKIKVKFLEKLAFNNNGTKYFIINVDNLNQEELHAKILKQITELN